MSNKKKVNRAIQFIVDNSYTFLPAECHEWVIDQVLQILTGCTESYLSEEYMELVEDAEYEGYTWNHGRKPTQEEFEDASWLPDDDDNV